MSALCVCCLGPDYCTSGIGRIGADSSEGLVLRIVAKKIEELLEEIKYYEWTPKNPPPSATSHVIEELMIYLQVRYPP